MAAGLADPVLDRLPGARDGRRHVVEQGGLSEAGGCGLDPVPAAMGVEEGGVARVAEELAPGGRRAVGLSPPGGVGPSEIGDRSGGVEGGLSPLQQGVAPGEAVVEPGGELRGRAPVAVGGPLNVGARKRAALRSRALPAPRPVRPWPRGRVPPRGRVRRRASPVPPPPAGRVRRGPSRPARSRSGSRASWMPMSTGAPPRAARCSSISLFGMSRSSASPSSRTARASPSQSRRAAALSAPPCPIAAIESSMWRRSISGARRRKDSIRARFRSRFSARSFSAARASSAARVSADRAGSGFAGAAAGDGVAAVERDWVRGSGAGGRLDGWGSVEGVARWACLEPVRAGRAAWRSFGVERVRARAAAARIRSYSTMVSASVSAAAPGRRPVRTSSRAWRMMRGASFVMQGWTPWRRAAARLALASARNLS